MTVGLGLVDDDGIEQALATHALDHRASDLLQALTEELAKCLGSFDHLLLADDFQSAKGNGAA